MVVCLSRNGISFLDLVHPLYQFTEPDSIAVAMSLKGDLHHCEQPKAQCLG